MGDVKKVLRKGEKLGKKAIGAQMTLMGAQPGSEGIGGDIAEVGTLGHMESGKTKKAKAAAASAEAEQQSILTEQKRQLEEEEEKRKKRTAKGKAGKRSLLYAGGSERGVSQTLGG